jgi:hypothetical protein
MRARWTWTDRTPTAEKTEGAEMNPKGKKVLAGGGMLPMLLMAVAVFSDATTDLPLERFTPEQQQKLLAGQVVYEYVLHGNEKNGLGHGQAFAIIDRPARVCYNEIIKFDLKYQYFPRMVRSKIIQNEGNSAWISVISDYKILKIDYVLQMIMDPQRMRVDYRLDTSYPHDIKDLEGFYSFQEIDEHRALVTCAVSRVDPGIRLPGFIARALSSRDLPRTVRNIKKRFESEGKWTKE